MFGSSGSVGTEAVDLDITGARVRVLSDHPDVAQQLRTILAGHLTEEPADPGFMIQAPDNPGALHVLVDHSGFVLARTRTAADSIAVLLSHLGALLQPPDDTVRLRMRAVVGPDARAVLTGFPLFSSPPAIEGQLSRVSHRIVDRLVVDITPAGELEMTPAPWLDNDNDNDGDIRGHLRPDGRRIEIRSIIVPKAGPDVPSRAQVVAFLARALAGTSRDVAMSVAERLADKDPAAVDVEDRNGVYEALSV